MKNFTFKKLKEAKSIHDFAPILGFKPKGLSYILFKVPDEQKYKQFTIPKKAGGVRTINAPVKGLKRAQRMLANILNECVQEIEN